VTRRIFLTIVATTALAVVLFGVPMAIVVNRRVHDDAVIELQRAAFDRAAVVSPSEINSGHVELPPTESAIDVAIYDSNGTKVGGAGPATADQLVAAAAKGGVHDGVVGSERVIAVPLQGEDGSGGVVRAAEPRSEVRQRELMTWLAMAGVGVLAVAVAAGAGALLARRLTRPVRRLRDASVRLGEGDFTVVAPPSGVAELDDVGGALTATARRLGATIERERTFAADASHQLRTPLASLRLALENELTSPRADPRLALHEALADVDRLDATVTNLLALAREPIPPRNPVAVEALVEGAESRWRHVLAANGRALQVDVEPGTAPVVVSAAAVSTVLDVLLDNALHHGAGVVTLSGAPAPRDGVVLIVGDEGEVTLPDGTLFAPRAADGRQHGIGLALARSLAEAEGLRLLLARRRPTAFELVLPGAS
jgi:signal transduction histidine kinase